jgi:ribose-phosphate pyrophosphokinase
MRLARRGVRLAMLFFCLDQSANLGSAVAKAGRFPLQSHEHRSFDGGEHKTRPLVSVRGKDVYVLLSLNGDAEASANDKLCRLLFFLATCREHGASRLTAIVPYLAYSRKDQQTKPRDPVTTRYVAALFEAVGTDTIVTLDVHNLSAFQNAFRCRNIHLDSRRLFSDAILDVAGPGPIAIVSPDSGGVKRAELLREALEVVAGRPVAFGYMEKRRSAGVVSGGAFAGDVAGRQVWIVDDMIVGGTTMLRAAQACNAAGAAAVHLLATHALFSAASFASLVNSQVCDVTVTDSVASRVGADGAADKLRVLPIAKLIAQSVLRLHAGQSMTDLLEPVPRPATRR